ncbi:hypothetical protein [Micromonospora sp. NPDC047074]
MERIFCFAEAAFPAGASIVGKLRTAERARFLVRLRVRVDGGRP